MATVSTSRRRTPARASKDRDLTTAVRGILSRWPAVGLAVGVVRDGRPDAFVGGGLADIASRAPVTEDTVFRIASVTKLFTAVAVMQLVERGLIDLDAPAGTYLQAFRLLPADPAFGPPTVRHLLTHTSGIPDVVNLADLLHPGWGPFGSRPGAVSVAVGEPMPPLAEVYGTGLRYVVEPGTIFAYTSHGYATLGQIVEETSGMPLDRYLRERIFEPLGMTDTSLDGPGRTPWQRATGYDVGPRGPRPITDRDWVTRGASSVSSTTRDMGRLLTALLGGGANEHGRMLEPATLATMFDAHHQPDPRLPGMGLGFFRGDAAGHRVVGHDGRLPGFNAQLLVAPDDGIGLVALTNGSSAAMAWLPTEMDRLLRHLLGIPEQALRTDLPHHPEVWEEVCGRYRLPGRVTDVRGRLMMGRGVEVFVRGGRLMARILVPVPALFRGVPLHPDDPDDPYAFRIDLSGFGMGTGRVVFGRGPGGVPALHTDIGLVSLLREPEPSGPSARMITLAGLLATAAMVVRRRRRSRAVHPCRSTG